MKKLILDIENLVNKANLFNLGEFTLELIYNDYDGYIYLALIDDKKEYLLGYTRLVPNINYTKLTRNNLSKDLVCIKLNEVADDLITPDNLNKDYAFFLLERGDN